MRDAPPVCVFDLDGTLVDTAADLIGTLNMVLAEIGVARLAVSAARDLVGAGARALLRRGLAVRQLKPDEGEIDRLFDRFLSLYGDRIAVESRPYPGVEDALDALAAEGYRLAVCTNKLEALSRRLLEELGLAHRFQAIVGPDTINIAKPDPRVLAHAVERAGGRLPRAVMVGDSPTDVNTAREAGVAIIGLTFGYTPIPMDRLNPDRLASDFREVARHVRELMPMLPAGELPSSP